tara:strand:+ start:253 stop:2094 length:1842 start_codon:yes stop_codon:yes gene_type:complete
MSESVMLHDAWRLLKDFSFRRNLPEEYYNTLPERMVRHIESRRPLEHVEGAVHPHYADRKQERYNENQALPREFNTRAAKKYKFTLEDIMMFMANDVASQHPELKQVMNMRLPASDKSLPNRDPSMHFDAFQTSRPKATEHGMQSLMTPHFTLNSRSGKLELKTVGSGGMNDKSRQSIHAKPTTSPIATDNHDNAKIHESLPQRFDFMEREAPPGQAVETASPIQPDEPKDPYAGLPPAFAEMMRQRDADNENKSEPMDIALRLLKDQDAMKEAFDLGHELIPYDELHDKQRAVVDMITNNQSKSYWNDPVSGEYETEIHTNMFRPETHHLYPDEAYDEYMRYLQHFYAASAETNNLPHEEQVKIMRHYTDYGEEHPLHPDEIARQKMADEYEHWNSDDPHGDFYNRYSEQPYNEPESFESNFQQKNASEPMDIALRLLKNFVLEPDNPEQAYFQSSMGYHPETGKVGYVPNTEVDPLNDVRINLASPKQFMLRDRDGNPVDDGAGFDQFVQRVGKDLQHEHTHGAIDREIRQAYLDKILPSENVFSAHEVGAIAAQNPGEGFANQRVADRVSESETKHHPTTRDWRAEQSPFADGRWSPQPAYSSNSEEGYE